MMAFEKVLLIFKVLVAVFKAGFRKIWPQAEKSICNETALITGAGHGMGQLIALKLASLGAKVVLVDINEANNRKTAELVKESGFTAFAYTCDVAEIDEVKRLAENVRKDVGEVTILVNNAGVGNNGHISSTSEKKIQQTFDVNILSHFWLIREFLPDMKKKNHGHILAMSSMIGRIGFPFGTDYSATKHAIIGLMEGLNRELRWQGKTGIKTTYICPGVVDTGFLDIPVDGMNILKPKIVVEQIIHAFLTEQSYLDLPNDSGPLGIFQAILPDEAMEMIVDFVAPKQQMLDHFAIKQKQL